MTLARAINYLNYLAGALIAGWLILATIGGSMGSASLVEAGIWLAIAAFPVYAAMLVLFGVELSPWYRRRQHARFQARLDRISRRARLEASYRLRRTG